MRQKSSLCFCLIRESSIIAAMARRIENKIGLDEFVPAQTWDSFSSDWEDLGPGLMGKGKAELYDIGCAYLTAAFQSRVARVTPAQEDFALRYIVGIIDRIGVGATQGKLGSAYGLAHNLPGDAALRFHEAMSRHGAHLEEAWRWDPDSFPPAVLRTMLVESLANRRGARRNRDLDHAALRLAHLWWEATGKKATISSYTRTEEHGPPRSAFGKFALAVLGALDPTVKDKAVTTACRQAVAGINKAARGT